MDQSRRETLERFQKQYEFYRKSFLQGGEFSFHAAIYVLTTMFSTSDFSAEELLEAIGDENVAQKVFVYFSEKRRCVKEATVAKAKIDMEKIQTMVDAMIEAEIPTQAIIRAVFNEMAAGQYRALMKQPGFSDLLEKLGISAEYLNKHFSILSSSLLMIPPWKIEQD